MAVRRGARTTRTLLLALTLLGAPSARSDVALAAIVSDGMILQQGIRPPIWPRLNHGPASTRGR